MKVGRDLISRVTDRVMDDVRDWGKRPLEDIYPIVFLDCMVLKIREGGTGWLLALTGALVRLDLPSAMTYQAEGLAALGDPTRREIFERLADRSWAVGELAHELPVSRPAVSQHLKVLKDAGLVIDRPDGNRRIYQVDPDGVAALRAYLDQFWNRSLAAFKAVADEHDEEDS